MRLFPNLAIPRTYMTPNRLSLFPLYTRQQLSTDVNQVLKCLSASVTLYCGGINSLLHRWQHCFDFVNNAVFEPSYDFFKMLVQKGHLFWPTWYCVIFLVFISQQEKNIKKIMKMFLFILRVIHFLNIKTAMAPLCSC